MGGMHPSHYLVKTLSGSVQPESTRPWSATIVHCKDTIILIKYHYLMTFLS